MGGPPTHLCAGLDVGATKVALLVAAREPDGVVRYVEAAYTWRLLEGVGHFPHEEDPTTVETELLRWLHDDLG